MISMSQLLQSLLEREDELNPAVETALAIQAYYTDPGIHTFVSRETVETALKEGQKDAERLKVSFQRLLEISDDA